MTKLFRMPKKTDINPIFLELFPKRLSKGDRKKAAIVEESIRLAGTEGIAALTLDSVGKSLDIRRSHVAYYFKTKRELMEASLELCIATGQAIVTRNLAEIKGPRAQLKAYLKGTYDWLRRYPHQVIFCMGLYVLAATDKRWLELNTAFKNAGKGRIREIVKVGWSKKLSSAELDKISLRAHNILVINIINHFSVTPKQSVKQAEIDTLREILDLLGTNFR